MHFCVNLEPHSRFFPRICWENIEFSLKRASLLRHFIISSASNWIGFHLDNIFMRVKETKGRIFNKTGLGTAWDAEQSDRFISSDCEYIWLSLMRHYLYSGYPGSLSLWPREIKLQKQLLLHSSFKSPGNKCEEKIET